MKVKSRTGLFVLVISLYVALPVCVKTQEARQIRVSAALAAQPAAQAGSQVPTIPPTVATIWPAGMSRGATETFTLEGRNLSRAKEVLFDDPGLRAHFLSVVDVAEKARKIRVNVDLGAEVPQGKKQEVQIQVTASPSASPGIHWLRIQTPLGTSNLVALDLTTLPQIQSKEPGVTSGKPQPVALPATIVGTVATPGEVN